MTQGELERVEQTEQQLAALTVGFAALSELVANLSFAVRAIVESSRELPGEQAIEPENARIN